MEFIGMVKMKPSYDKTALLWYFLAYHAHFEAK